MVQVPGQQMGGGLDNFMSNLTKAGVLFVGIPFAISRTLVQGSIGIIRNPRTVKVAAEKTTYQVFKQMTRPRNWFLYNTYEERGDVGSLIMGEPQEIGLQREFMAWQPRRWRGHSAGLLRRGAIPIPYPWFDVRAQTDSRWAIKIDLPDRYKPKSPPTSSSPSQQNGVGGGTQNYSKPTAVTESPSTSSDRTPFIRRYYATKSRRKIWCSRHNKSDYCYRRKKNR